MGAGQTLEFSINVDEQAAAMQEAQESAFVYERADGTVERANNSEEAIRLCPVLGKLAVEAPEQVDVLLELAAAGNAILDAQKKEQDPKPLRAEKTAGDSAKAAESPDFTARPEAAVQEFGDSTRELEVLVARSATGIQAEATENAENKVMSEAIIIGNKIDEARTAVIHEQMLLHEAAADALHTSTGLEVDEVPVSQPEAEVVGVPAAIETSVRGAAPPEEIPSQSDYLQEADDMLHDSANQESVIAEQLESVGDAAGVENVDTAETALAGGVVLAVETELSDHFIQSAEMDGPTTETAQPPGSTVFEVEPPALTVDDAEQKLHELLDKFETIEAEDKQNVTKILDAIHEMVVSESRLEAGVSEAHEAGEQVKAEVEQLLSELFEAAGISYEPEQVYSIAQLIFDRELSALVQEAEGNELPHDKGTHEFLQYLSAKVSAVKKAVLHPYFIGKSALVLYYRQSQPAY